MDTVQALCGMAPGDWARGDEGAVFGQLGGVKHNPERTRRHAQTCSPGREVAHHGQGHTREIIKRCPEQVLPDDGHGFLRQGQEQWHGPEFFREHDHVRSGLGDGNGFAKGDGDIGFGHGGEIIEAVSDGGHDLTQGLSCGNKVEFVSRAHARVHARCFQTDLLGHMGHRGLPVARQEEHSVVHRVQLRECFLGVRANVFTQDKGGHPTAGSHQMHLGVLCAVWYERRWTQGRTKFK